MKYLVFSFKLLLSSFTIVVLLYTKYQILNTAQAQTMSNSNYIIRMGNLNTAAGKPTGASYKLNLTVGQTGPGLYSGSNYIVKAGFQYISSIIPFKFTIDNTVINFGSLVSANGPQTRSNILRIDNQSAGGYTVKAYENHQLLFPAQGQVIPNTTCDNGLCTESTSDTWSSSTAYGFGYRCDIVDATNYCNAGFSTSTNYRQFADNSKSKIAQTVMSGQSARNQRGQVTYKVNISAGQAAGQYSNSITFIATPTY